MDEPIGVDQAERLDLPTDGERGVKDDGGFLKDIDQDLKLDSGPGCDLKDLKALADAARIPDHKKRLETMDKLLDMDKFISFWAVEAMCCDWDGYTRVEAGGGDSVF